MVKNGYLVHRVNVCSMNLSVYVLTMVLEKGYNIPTYSII